MFDVIVVGGGPGGSIAAKKCAQSGLKTLLLEKRKLPREKVCSGMIMGPLAKTLIKQEFGEIPDQVLVARLSGYMLHVPGVEPQTIDYETPIAWRKDLDYWMNQKAKEAGVEIWDGAKVTGVSERDGECTVVLEKQELKAKFVIGADGTTSVVRKSLFPELEVHHFQVSIRECYEGQIDVDKGYYHWFFPRGLPWPRFSAHHKGKFFLLHTTPRIGEARKLRDEARRLLAEDYGFDPKWKPLWRDGCIPYIRLYEELFSGSFVPAKRNILLVGDAAGQLPPHPIGAGIGTALNSGILAAASISNAIELRKNAAEPYLQELEPMLAIFKSLYPSAKAIEEEAAKGAQAFLVAFRESMEEALKKAA